MEVRKCEECGKEFRRKRKVAPDGRIVDGARFCSKACYGKSRSRRSRERSAMPAAVAGRLAGHLAEWFGSWERQRIIRPAVHSCGRCGRRSQRKSSRFCSDECQFPEGMIACSSCGSETLGRVGRSGRCSECKRKERKRHKKSGSHRKRCRSKGLPHDPRVTLSRVRQRDRGRCRACGCLTLEVYTFRHSPLFGETEADPRSPTIDHIVPLKHPANTRHGHTMDNTQLLCWVCNSGKSDAITIQGIIESDNPRRFMLANERTSPATGGG
jgi:hypothetical protein